MIISPEYAEELGRQIDELEAENERLREFSTYARLSAETAPVIKAAIRKHFKSIGTSSVVSSDGIERVYYSGFSLDKLADAVAAGLAAQPPVETLNEQAREHPRYDNPRDPFAAPQRSSAAPVEGEGWLHLKAKRVLSVDRGQTTVLCDRDIPTELLVLVDASDAREDALEAQGTIEQLEKQLAFERKKSEPSFLHAGSPLWRIDLLCEQHELYTKDELVGLIQKMVQEAGRPNV